jgi:phytoene synthase
MTETPELSYCAEYVRKNDRDRFLCALFADPAKREDLFTLYAFNQEISKTREMVSEAMLGQIRLQWWRETLDGIEKGEVRKHEVVEPLADLLGRGQIKREDLDALIDAREFDLEDTAPKDLDELDLYVDRTSGKLAVLAASLLGARSDESLEAARLAGQAYGLVGILRAIVFHGRAKRLYLPTETMDRHGVKQGDIFEFRSTDSVKEMTGALASHAWLRIARARKSRKALPKSVLPAALPLILGEGYLRKLRKTGHDPFSAEFGLARPASMRLTLRAMMGKL